MVSAKFLSFSILLAGATALLPAMEPVAKEGWEPLAELAEKGVETHVYPGAVLIVGQPGETLFAQTFGHYTYEPDAPEMTFDSMFDLASVSKVVGTTSAALLLLEDGTISLDDKVSKYIDGFDAGGKESDTIRELMTHTSGLKAYETWSKVEAERERGESQADALIRRYASLKTSYEPRTDYKYSCLNFQTLARVVENASNERMEDLLRERVYGPLKMENTTYVMSGEQKKRAVPTAIEPDGTTIVGKVHDPLARYYGWETHCPGNAGLFAAAPDVARYCEMILEDGELDGVRIYKPETVAMATDVMTPPDIGEKRGLGFDVWESKPYVTDLNSDSETFIVGHTGYTGTLIWLDKKTDTYIVFFTNRSYPDDGHKAELTAIRKSICEQVLRNLPEYDDYFANLTEKEARKPSTGG